MSLSMFKLEANHSIVSDGHSIAEIELKNICRDGGESNFKAQLLIEMIFRRHVLTKIKVDKSLRQFWSDVSSDLKSKCSYERLTPVYCEDIFVHILAQLVSNVHSANSFEELNIKVPLIKHLIELPLDLFLDHNSYDILVNIVMRTEFKKLLYSHEMHSFEIFDNNFNKFVALNESVGMKNAANIENRKKPKTQSCRKKSSKNLDLIASPKSNGYSWKHFNDDNANAEILIEMFLQHKLITETRIAKNLGKFWNIVSKNLRREMFGQYFTAYHCEKEFIQLMAQLVTALRNVNNYDELVITFPLINYLIALPLEFFMEETALKKLHTLNNQINQNFSIKNFENNKINNNLESIAKVEPKNVAKTETVINNNTLSPLNQILQYIKSQNGSIEDCDEC